MPEKRRMVYLFWVYEHWFFFNRFLSYMDGRFRQQLTIIDVSMSVALLIISTYFQKTLFQQRWCLQVFGLCDRITWKQINWKTTNDKYRKKDFSKCWYVPRTKPPPDFIYKFHNLCRKYDFVKKLLMTSKTLKNNYCQLTSSPKVNSKTKISRSSQISISSRCLFANNRDEA